MNDYLTGIFIGAIFVWTVMVTLPFTIQVQGKKALETCEKELPKDQYCILTAIPKKKKNCQYEYDYE